MPTPLIIDCDECTMQGTNQCDDCIVTFICDRDESQPVVVDAEEARAVRLLSEGGLVPALRHRRRTPRAVHSPGGPKC
jgi:hypothetical protein